VLGSQRRGEGGTWVSRKIVLDMGRTFLETENITKQNTVLITRVKWSEIFVAYIYIHTF